VLTTCCALSFSIALRLALDWASGLHISALCSYNAIRRLYALRQRRRYVKINTLIRADGHRNAVNASPERLLFLSLSCTNHACSYTRPRIVMIKPAALAAPVDDLERFGQRQPVLIRRLQETKKLTSLLCLFSNQPYWFIKTGPSS